MTNRILTWDGCNNVRDLGGLKTSNGGITRHGSIIRADTPTRLTAAGWSALYDYGIRTIVTLRTHGMTEDELDVVSPYADINIVQVAIEDITDQEFVERCVDNSLWGTPIYFQDVIRRWPQRHAAAISAIAQAQPGGVVFHCIRGYDRTGIISFLLLSLAGVTLDEIITDYELSVDPIRDQILAREKTTVREAMINTLDGINLDDYFLSSGSSKDDLKIIREKLLG